MRDYIQEFHAYLDRQLPEGDYVLPVVAAEVVEGLRTSDPDLLAGWLDVHAARFVVAYAGSVARSNRSSQVSDAPKRAFNAATDAFIVGDAGPLRAFKVHFVVNDDNLRRCLGDMTKADHLYVAEQHTHRANAALFEAAFHKAIAKKIPAGKKTADVMTEDAYLKLRKSIQARQESAA